MNDEKYKLELRKEFAKIEGDLAEQAKEFIKNWKIYKDVADMEENQIRNLLQISEETKSLEAIKSFIRYQIGRSDNKKQWKFKPDDTGERFGEALIWKLDSFLDEKEELIGYLVENYGKDKAEISWNLVRLYLGYVNWYFVYKKKFYRERT